MKYFLAIIFILIPLSSNATGLFIGADLLQANARHEANNTGSSGPKNNDVAESDNVNYGLNAGVRFDLLTLLASVELFYDNLNTSSRNFNQIDGTINNQDRIELKNRYGAKINAGFAILPRITPFITYGLTKVSYSSNVLSSNNSLSKTELTPLYGIGLLVDLPLGITAKASYDYQKIDMKYAGGGAKINTHLGVAKLGLVYNF